MTETAQQIAEQTINFVGETSDDEKMMYDALEKIADLPRLTIPKRIAEKLDKGGYAVEGFVFPRTWELEVQGTLESSRRIDIQKVYLAGKALGVDLVEVEQ